jgi:periplasmic protein TonB
MTTARYDLTGAAQSAERGAPLDYLRRQRAAKKHMPGIGFVIVLHVIIVYALVSGLARKAVEFVQKPLETKVIAEATKPPEEAPPPPPKMAPPPPPFIPPPEINIQVAVAPSPGAITAVTTAPPPKEAPPPPAPPAPPKAPVRTAPVVLAASCQPPAYPAASRRAGESGAVMLNFLIDTAGKVVESRIEASSGVERLDEAARRALALCKFTPGTIDGKPEQSWHKLRYVWQLER